MLSNFYKPINGETHLIKTIDSFICICIKKSHRKQYGKEPGTQTQIKTVHNSNPVSTYTEIQLQKVADGGISVCIQLERMIQTR